MEMIYFTVVAILLYVVSDRLLNWIEVRRGRRFENRTLVFFIIILVLAVIVFNLLQYQLKQGAGPAAPAGQGAAQTRP